MIKHKYVTLILVVAAAVMLFLIMLVVRAKNVGATSGGTAQAGDECNVHAEDESHICAPGLVCIPQNDNSEGNGKCQSLETATPIATVEPTATPCDDCDLTPSPTAGASATPIVTEPTPTPYPAETLPPDNGCAVRDCSVHDNYPNSSFDGHPVGWK